MPTDKGLFITFEGCEGSGKSTQLKLLREYFDQKGVSAVYTREPGGSPIAEQIRQILLDKDNLAMTDEAEALLYAAARIQHVKEKILPNKNSGKIVVCDRYLDSSFAYQAYARGLGYEFIAKINDEAMKTCMPDVTFFFDISPEAAFKRKGGADKEDRLEQSGMDFHKKVYDGYARLAEKFPERIIKIDARKDKDAIFDCVVKELKKFGI